MRHGTCVICWPAMHGAKIGVAMLLRCGACVSDVRGQSFGLGSPLGEGGYVIKTHPPGDALGCQQLYIRSWTRGSLVDPWLALVSDQ